MAPAQRLIQPGTDPTPAAIAPLLDEMILSASGWRTVFAEDGNEASFTAGVRPAHLVLAALAAQTFAEQVRRETGSSQRILVACDSRPTGPSIAEAAIRAFLDAGLEPVYLDVTPSPEIMACTREWPDCMGFFYVTASHNPVGHNGLKMGFADGSVVGGEKSGALVNRFRELAANDSSVAAAAVSLARGRPSSVRGVLSAAARNRKAADRIYRKFTERVVAGPGPESGRAMDALSVNLRRVRPGIVIDFNGSARCESIDREILKGFGCRIRAVNDRAGQIAHQIVPEGEGLADCVRELASASSADPAFLLGYVPDNDGDRGNLVFARSPGIARQLDAQQVFALAAVSELCWLKYTGSEGSSDTGIARSSESRGDSGRKPSAIVVNGPTSMRIDRIAQKLGVEVHRAEVGEANVVARARELRDEGYTVRFLGEGSNGGNITHPSTVRDPIQTVFAVLKLLYAPELPGRQPPAAIWLKAAAGAAGTAPVEGETTVAPVAAEPLDGGAVSLGQLLDSLPGYTTTSAFSPLAMMKVTCTDHARLKSEVEDIWDRRWPDLVDLQRVLGVKSYRYENYEGTICRPGRGNRTGSGRGGFKILLEDGSGECRAFLWMRGSGTEPVFRVMVDVEGHRPEVESELLSLLREMVGEADLAVQSSTG